MRTRALFLTIASLALVAPAPVRAAEAVTLPGAPLTVSVGSLGQCQSSYASLGNDFYPPEGTLGDCGFFLGFPGSGNPSALQKRVFGFAGVRGPSLSAHYAPLLQRTPTGSGSPSDPYRQVTTFTVDEEGAAYALIEETTTYVAGEAQFLSTYDVENVTGQSGVEALGLKPAAATPLRFQAIYAGDSSSGGEALGAGLLLAGPPRFVGVRNETAGAIGGFVEAPSPSPPWTSYAAGCWDAVPEAAGRCTGASTNDRGIWTAVRDATGAAPAFDDGVDPATLDGGVGVSWANRLNAPLQPGEHASYTIVNRADVPAPLSVTPASQTQTVGTTATITVTATDDAGLPYIERPIVYTIGEANPKTGSVLTNAAGVATIAYTGTVPGSDTVQMFLDLAASGAAAARDPAATTHVAWAPPPPSASSRFSVRSAHAASDGTIAIVIVPSQDGTATMQVTTPTAAIARATKQRTATNKPAAKRIRCKRGLVAIDGRCRPETTVTGKLLANGHAGAALRLVVKPASEVTQALVRGKAVVLTAKLVYRSALGGKPATRSFRFTVRRKSAKSAR